MPSNRISPLVVYLVNHPIDARRRFEWSLLPRETHNVGSPYRCHP